MKSSYALSMITLSTLGVISLQAQSVSAADLKQWAITFYDNGDNRVGQGTFSYNLATERFIAEDESGYYGLTVRTAIDSFSATIMNIDWESRGDNIWWGDGSTPPGFQNRSRYGTFLNYDRWFLGDGDFGEYTLSLRFSSSSDVFGEGTWSQFFIFSEPPIEGSGTWTATLVPEPLTLLGTLTAVGFGAFFKRKSGQ